MVNFTVAKVKQVGSGDVSPLPQKRMVLSFAKNGNFNLIPGLHPKNLADICNKH
jgi:hypothetical protein